MGLLGSRLGGLVIYIGYLRLQAAWGFRLVLFCVVT